MRTTSVFLVASLFAIACGEKDVVDDTGGTEDTSLPDDYNHMTVEQKNFYMTTVVLPTMSAKFKDFDGETYANFSCGTCHGTGATDGTYSMPNADLYELPLDSFPQPEDGSYEAFMYEEVLPTMTDLLDQEGTASCESCHTTG